MPIAPVIGASAFEFRARVQPITAAGQKILDPSTGRSRIVLHNAGTVPVQVFYTVDGSGDPTVILAGAGALDNGTGTTWVDSDWQGAVWLKAPAGGGNVLASAY